jgi:hypothetical protein
MQKKLRTWALGTALSIACFSGSSEAASEVTLDARALPAIAAIDERFQSYNVEMAQIIGAPFWKPYAHMSPLAERKGVSTAGLDPNLFEARPPVDLHDPRLRNLAAALGPAYVRVSGTWANTVYFQDNDDPPLHNPPPAFRGVLTRAEWRGVVEFAKSVDAKLVTSFAIGASIRDSSGIWTADQAKQLIDYTRAIGGTIYAAELFNEPNLSRFGGGPPRYNASDFARDEAVFRNFVTREAPDLKSAGPGEVDIASMPTAALMSAEPRPHFDIFSYHFYGAVSERCAPATAPQGTTADQALTESWLARTDEAFQREKAVRDAFAPAAPIWISETAGAACGGEPWDTTFLDTFRYLDQMGRLAKQGASAVFHNTLAASEYGLIDEATLRPRPNYWAAVLWRRLMGTTVLDAGPIRPGLHVYAHCLRGRTGGVSLLAIDNGKSAATLALSSPADAYAVSAPKLESTDAMLNGRLLAAGPDGQIPALLAVHVGHAFTLSPTSIAFIALPHAANPYC